MTTRVLDEYLLSLLQFLLLFSLHRLLSIGLCFLVRPIYNSIFIVCFVSAARVYRMLAAVMSSLRERTR